MTFSSGTSVLRGVRRSLPSPSGRDRRCGSVRSPRSMRSALRLREKTALRSVLVWPVFAFARSDPRIGSASGCRCGRRTGSGTSPRSSAIPRAPPPGASTLIVSLQSRSAYRVASLRVCAAARFVTAATSPVLPVSSRSYSWSQSSPASSSKSTSGFELREPERVADLLDLRRASPLDLPAAAGERLRPSRAHPQEAVREAAAESSVADSFWRSSSAVMCATIETCAPVADRRRALRHRPQGRAFPGLPDAPG